MYWLYVTINDNVKCYPNINVSGYSSRKLVTFGIVMLKLFVAHIERQGNFLKENKKSECQ